MRKKNTSGSLEEREIEVGARAEERVFPLLFQVLPNIHKCFYNSVCGNTEIYKIIYEITRIK